MNILLHISYNGSAYHGFQVQQNAVTVCEVVQNAIEAVFSARPDVKGCSRTDAGVHARGFCLNFKHETDIPMQKLPLALNSHLPHDIRVTRAEAAKNDFHARYSALGKQYEYTILNSGIDDVFNSGFYHRMPAPLNEKEMNAAAQQLLGKHNFAAFMAAGSTIEDTVRTIKDAGVTRRGNYVVFSVTADGFLYNMVRIMAGTLALAGQGRLCSDDIPRIIESKNRKNAGPTLPACGLCLTKVFY